MAPVFDATAVFTVTAVKLPWEGRDRRRRDENNGLTCNLQMSKVSRLEKRGRCVCVFMLGGAQGGGLPEG